MYSSRRALARTALFNQMTCTSRQVQKLGRAADALAARIVVKLNHTTAAGRERSGPDIDFRLTRPRTQNLLDEKENGRTAHLDCIPRMLSRGQTFEAELSSQTGVIGYRAVVEANGDACRWRFFAGPMSDCHSVQRALPANNVLGSGRRWPRRQR